MLALLGAGLLLSCSPKDWAIFDFSDLRSRQPGYGRIAADAMARGFGRPDERVAHDPAEADRHVGRLRLEFRFEEKDAALQAAADAHSDAIVLGELLDYLVHRTGRSWKAAAAVRIVAYDAHTGLPIRGALARGDSSSAVDGFRGASLVDAIENAAKNASAAMERLRLPEATVISTGPRFATIDRGSDEGFKVGDKVWLRRGPISTCTGTVSQLSRESGEIFFERILGGLAPGDRVFQVYVVPPLPRASGCLLWPSGRAGTK